LSALSSDYRMCQLTLVPVDLGNHPSSSPHCLVDHLDSKENQLSPLKGITILTLLPVAPTAPTPLIPGLTPLFAPALPTAGLAVAGGGRRAGAGTPLLPTAEDPALLTPRLDGPAAAVLLVETANEVAGRLVVEAIVALAFLVVGTNPLGFLAPGPAVD